MMTRILKYLLITMLALHAFHAAGQYSIDKVCRGAERYYRVTGEENATYRWQIREPSGNVVPQLSDQDTIGIIWNMPPGIYELSVIQHGQNNCDAEMQLGTVEVFEPPLADAGNNQVICAGSPLLLSNASASWYSNVLWRTSGDGVFDDSTSLHPTYQPGSQDIINGSVVLTLTAFGLGNSGSCLPAASSMVVTFNSISIVTSSLPAGCAGATNGSVTLFASGGLEPYLYSLNGIQNTTGTFMNLAAGIYNYHVTDSLGCAGNGIVEVENDASLAASLTYDSVSCYGSSDGFILVLNPTGGSGNYEFSLDMLAWQTDPVFTGLGAGTYLVYMRDSLAPVCSTLIDSVVVNQPEALYGEVIHVNVSVPGANDGSLKVVNVSGGSGYYEFSIDGTNWQSSPEFLNLAAGSYTVLIRDSIMQSCQYSIGTVIIGEGMMLVTGAIDVSCFGYSDGSVSVTVSGGNPPFTYLWNDAASQNTATASNLPAGIYTVLVTDSLGITATATDTIHQPDEIIPLFAAIGPLCQNSVPPALPDTSINGISGTWTPSVINTAIPGLQTFTFHPDAGMCASGTTITIEISNEIVPQFNPVGPLCVNSTPPALPSVSVNNITGVWQPAQVNTSIAGIFNYTFVPDTGQCAVQFIMQIEIGDSIAPVFNEVGTLCLNSQAPPLPSVSLNGISGSWSPAIINTTVPGTTIYTFTPQAGQCAGTYSMGVQVTETIVPVFTGIGPLCQNSQPPLLPAVSMNGITGNWSPSVISTVLPGSTLYTFVPDSGQCAVNATLEVQILENIIPEFLPIGPLCQNSVSPVLPDTSQNQVTGYWTPDVISTVSAGIQTLVFTPDTGQCALPVTIQVEISDSITPQFVPISPLCRNSMAPQLPSVSVNGIQGQWNPAQINTSVAGTHQYQFVPDDALCARTVVLEVTIVDEIQPLFDPVGPLCIMSEAPVLPEVSLNGISGRWIPSLINTSQAGISSYTFIADTGQCATGISMNIEVTSEILPVFPPIGPLCLNSIPPELPDTAANGITGHWTPAVIRTDSMGIVIHTFLPDTGQCAGTFTLQVFIDSPMITSVQTMTATNGSPNGWASVSATANAMPLRYSLDGANWQSSELFSQLSAGDYMAYVKDANDCVAQQPFTIMNTVTGEVGVLAGDVQSCISLPFEIPVMAYDFTAISSFTIQLSFDSTIVSFIDLSQVNSQLGNGTLIDTLLSPGTLLISFESIDSLTLISEDMLFVLNFQGSSAGLTQIKWDWLQCTIFSSEGYELPAIYTKGNVDIRPAPVVYTSGSGEYCEGTELELHSGSLTGQQLYYQWTGPSGTIHQGQDWDLGSLDTTYTGVYRLSATDSTGCFREELLPLLVHPNPSITLSDHDTLCSEQTIVLTPGIGFNEYLWQDGTTAPQLVATNEGLYWVLVTDRNGCMGSDSVLLRPCELLIWMPNAFTPNKDELNDIFTAKCNLDIPITFHMIIFNKWGEELFRTNDIRKGWDGTYKGVPCPQDLYTWRISFSAPDTYNFLQKSPQTGTVMLLR